uniref:Uncharacterized protein n=1 Tax=Arundo donax TaxID=35708 RepID=A0A0A9AUQ5_ARUDO
MKVRYVLLLLLIRQHFQAFTI